MAITEQERYKELQEEYEPPALIAWLIAFAFDIFLWIVIISLISTLISCTKIGASVGSVNSQSCSITRPNIILILADDIGFEIPTCNGGQSYQTPNIDALAAAGLRFTQCHSCPSCSPSRYEIMTGKYSFRNYFEQYNMSTDNKTFANMLHDAGYSTAIFGKWQLNGGADHTSIFGFDKGLLYNPYRDSISGSRYKNPLLYNGHYIQYSNGEYGEDVLTDSVIAFTNTATQPYFAYYTMVSAHEPLSPTPDDAIYASWNSSQNADTSYYKSMVKYMDKCIGRIRASITGNTIIIFTGDNGTARQEYSWFNGELIRGGKGTTLEYGTHVPLMAYWPGHIQTGIDSSLVDFSDFLPTLADIVGVARPTTYGVLDGVSFYPQITGQAGTKRTWIFCMFEGKRWVQNYQYKLYDSTELLYSIKHSFKEKRPLTDLSPQQQKTKDFFDSMLNVLQ